MDSSSVPSPNSLHTEGTLNRAKLERFRLLSTSELKLSLAPGQQGSLKVRPEGTVLDGRHESACSKNEVPAARMRSATSSGGRDIYLAPDASRLPV